MGRVDTKSDSPPARPAGRPRRLTLDRLLDTAIEMGLPDLNMKELAANLGVGIATLYRYVDNREALIRLAVGRQAIRALPIDRGQPWRELVMDHATSLFSSVGQQPSLVIEFVEARWGIEVELESVDGFLGALKARGFTAREAMDLYRAMAKIVLGAAVAAGHFAALATRGTNQARELKSALESWDEEELPHLRAAADDYADEAAAAAWKPILEAVMEQMAGHHP
jgi:AcrR family transcriptional regulator